MKFCTFGKRYDRTSGIRGSARWTVHYQPLATPSVHGLHVKFPNGNTVSVQWGPGNYCDNRYAPLRASQEAEKRGEEWPAATAEIAAWRDIREDETPARTLMSWRSKPPERATPLRGRTIWHTFDCGDQVRGWLSPEKVIEFLDFAEKNELDVRERKYDYYLDEVVIVGHLTLRQKVLRGWFKFLEWIAEKRANCPEGEEE